MPIEDFIITVYCMIDEILSKKIAQQPLRLRGFVPKLSDSEVITMEIVGEFLGIDTDKNIWSYFCSHWKSWFPALGSRCNFARQAANLWRLKQLIQEELATQLGAISESIHFVDGFPMPICKYARAYKSKLFCTKASFSYCAAKQEKYYGFRGNMIIDFSGVISGITITSANIDERISLLDITGKIQGLMIGDMGYIGDEFQNELRIQKGINLQTPKRSNMQDDRDPKFIKAMKSCRRLIETVIGQLTERFNIEKVWARDLWHLTSRVGRKILAHTMAIFINSKIGRKPLQFDGLITC